jgi:hypothetical protein
MDQHNKLLNVLSTMTKEPESKKEQDNFYSFLCPIEIRDPSANENATFLFTVIREVSFFG